MHSRYLYILVVIIGFIVYEVYLIFVDTYNNHQKDSYISYLTQKNTSIQNTMEEKRMHNEYIRTTAYKERIAKASQWKQLPGETVINLVNSEEVELYKGFDVTKELISAEKQKPSPTQGMKNQEKWMYYLFRIDIRKSEEE